MDLCQNHVANKNDIHSNILNIATKFKTSVPATVLLFRLICCYDYSIHVEGLLPTKLCLVTLLNSELCSEFKRFHPQHVKMVKKNPVSNEN